MHSLSCWGIGFGCGICLVLAVAALTRNERVQAATVEPTFMVKSTMDGVDQPCLFVPAKADEARPLLVMLHPWSHSFGTYGDLTEWQVEAEKRDWHYLQPDFRGPNNTPDACASSKARQDVLDAVAYAIAHVKVDTSRLYLAGGSGGGHMSLVMAGHAPERWSAVSAWCPISDLSAWHRETMAAGMKYYRDIEASCGGAPGTSAEVDKEIHDRSPIHFLENIGDLPLEISTGIHDGHTGPNGLTGSVPIHHTLDAFNVVAAIRGDAGVTAEEIVTLSERKPLPAAAEQDPGLGRQIHLRRTSGQCRVTIFEGGHEALAGPACEWLSQHTRETR